MIHLLPVSNRLRFVAQAIEDLNPIMNAAADAYDNGDRGPLVKAVIDLADDFIGHLEAHLTN